MDLLTQLTKAVAFIEEHICDEISLCEIAKSTAFSPYHFGRIFYYITEMPLSEYVRKRKLTLAALELQNSNIKVIDLAVKYNYNSADGFTRAFVNHHGVTPTTARKAGVTLKFFAPITFQIKIKGVQEMNWRIEQKEAFEVYGIEKIFKNDDVRASEFWDETAKDGRRLKLPEVHGLVNYYDSGKDTIPYMIFAFKKAGRETTRYKEVQVSQYTWAVFRAEVKNHGDCCQVPQLFGHAYTEWLPSSGYEKADGPDMEIYGDDFEEVWIPVIKK